MSLLLSQFSQYIVGGEEIDYVEIRLGEQYVLPFTIKDDQDPPQPIDLTGWTFAVTSQIFTATFTYAAGGNLSSVSNFTQQGATAPYAGLEVVNVVPLAGTGVLKVPAGVNPSPSTLVTPNDNNTMLNLITINCTYPSSVSGFDNIRKLMIGLVVRYGS